MIVSRVFGVARVVVGPAVRREGSAEAKLRMFSAPMKTPRTPGKPRASAPGRRRGRWLVPLLAFLPGCGVLRATAETPGRLAQSVIPGKTAQEPQLELLLADLIRYSDLVVFRIEEASRDFERIVATPEAGLQASRWRLDSFRWATQLASGSNSISGLLDLVAIMTVFGWMVEDQWIPSAGAAAQPLATALVHSREDGWQLVERYLPAADAKAARELLDAWRLEHPRIDRDLLLEFPSLTALALAKPGSSSSSLLGMVGLDPLSGLEPAARQIEETRQFGQRVLFFLQRAPRLIAAESELRLLELRESQEVRQVLADAERITATLEQFSATAAALPAQVSQEREAAVAQISAELGVQRSALLADLETAREPLESLLAETRATLVAGERMSSELTRTLDALDGFVGRFDAPADSAESPASAPVAEPAPEGKPFDVSDYGAAAERVAHAAAELNALVVALDQRLPEAQRLLDAATASANASVDHVFRRALTLGVLLIVVAAGAFLLVRRLGRGAVRSG